MIKFTVYLQLARLPFNNLCVPGVVACFATPDTFYQWAKEQKWFDCKGCRPLPERTPGVQKEKSASYILTIFCSIGGHPVSRGTRVLVNMWSIHHDPQHWDKPDLFCPGNSKHTHWGFLNNTEKCNFSLLSSHQNRSFPGWPRPACHALPLPALWGGASSLCWRIAGQAGAFPFLVFPAPANELQASRWGFST